MIAQYKHRDSLSAAKQDNISVETKPSIAAQASTGRSNHQQNATKPASSTQGIDSTSPDTGNIPTNRNPEPFITSICFFFAGQVGAMAYTDDAVLAKLSALNESHDSIATAAQWIMFHR